MISTKSSVLFIFLSALVNYPATGFRTGMTTYFVQNSGYQGRAHFERGNSNFLSYPKARCKFGGTTIGSRTGSLNLRMAEYMFGMEGITLQPGDRAFIVGVDIKRDK
jgi:hypothetical protein